MTRAINSADFRRRLTPPEHLSKPEAKLFRLVVASVASNHFQPCDVPLLVEFARATGLANKAAEALDREGAVIDGKANAWVTVQEKSVRALTALSARLRICPQARFDRTKAGVTARSGLPAGHDADTEPDERGDIYDPADPEGLLAGHRPALAADVRQIRAALERERMPASRLHLRVAAPLVREISAAVGNTTWDTRELLDEAVRDAALRADLEKRVSPIVQNH